MTHLCILRLSKIIILLVIVLSASGSFAPVVRAQTATPPPTVTSTPTPTSMPAAPAAVRMRLTAQSSPDPLPSGSEANITLNLTVERLPDAECVGISAYPLDAFLVVDNSASAGTGRGSNIELTQQWLLDWIAQAEQVNFPGTGGGTPQRIRLGVVASRVTARGTELLWQTLTDDYEQLRATVGNLAGGGDTELALGIQQATTALQQRARPNARQALVLVLHDRLPLTEEARAALQSAQQVGIDLYVFVNAFNLKAQAVDAATASFVDAEHFWRDPTSAQRQRALVQMTGGSNEYLAQDVTITAEWLPAGLTVIPGIGAAGNTMQWSVAHMAEQETAKQTYRAEVDAALAARGAVNTTAQIAYRDCNGISRTERADLTLRVEAARMTVTPAATLAGPATAFPATTLPATAVSAPISATSPISPATSASPTATVQPPPSNSPIQGPIDQFFAWLIGLIPGAATALTPMIGALPAILQWLLTILLILLLLFLFWRLFKMLKGLWGRKKPETPITGGETPLALPPEPAMPTLPRWISALPDNTLLPNDGSVVTVATATPHPVQDTLLVGLGAAGREVLAQVATGLNERFGAKWPENIRLLQVDVQPADASTHLAPPTGLHDKQWALLRPNYKEIASTLRTDQQAFAHWQWYESAAADDGRARGRMALFSDLGSGSTNSVLWRNLTNALQGMVSPVIRIIGTTFDDVSSGMLVDAARIVQLAATGNTDGNVDVQLWLVGLTGRDWSERLSGRGKIRADEQSARTLATLRELERFQHNAPVSFRYVPDTNRQDLFRATRQFALINKIVLFEPKIKPPIAPESDALACMADSLLALLNQETNSLWNAHLDGTRGTMSALANNEGQGAVLAVGSYAIRHPGAALTQALAWRMLRDVLFEMALGLFPIERLDHISGAYQSLSEVEQGQPLKSTSGPRSDAIDKLVRDYKGYWHTQAFAAAVRTQVTALLNGEVDSSEPLVERRAGLAQAIRWLKLLRGALLQNDAADAAQRVNALEKDLGAWQRWFKEQVYPVCEQSFRAARAELERLRTQPARGWGLDSALEWNFYRQHTRTWTTRPAGSAQADPMLRLAARFGWEVQAVDGGWRPRLIVPPGEFDQIIETRTLDLLRPFENVLPNADPEVLLRNLLPLAERIVQVDVQTSLLEIALNQDFSAWLKQAEPRVSYNRKLAAEKMRKVDLLTLLISPESALHTPQLAQRFANVPDMSGTFTSCTTNDPTAVTLLCVTSWLPLSTLDAYNPATWNENPVPPTLYVWRPEQIAAELEHDRRLSALLVSRIAENEPLLRAFGLAFLYQAITRESLGWRIPGMPETIPGTLYAALEAVFAADARLQATCLDALQAVLAERRRTVTDRRSYLKQVEIEQVRPLENQDARVQDLAAYLRGLVSIEGNR